MATVVTVNGIGFTGDPCRVVTATWNGRTFTAGERTWAALFAFQAWLDKHHLGYFVYVIQGAYNTGVALSAGTHDKDRVLDVAIINRKTGRRLWVRGRRWLRAHGWAAWWRNSGSWLKPSTWHIHMVLLGGACPVGYLIPAQIADYRGKRSGLVGHIADLTWHPKDIDATVFNFAAWLRTQQEEQMEYKDWSTESKKQLAADVASAVLDADLNVKGDKGEPEFAGKSVRWGLKKLIGRA